MFSSPVVPAIIPDTEAALRDFVAAIGPVPEIHVDVVDGQFVPFLSWPYEPQGNPVELLTLLEKCTLEVDLMVNDPLQAAWVWQQAGADMLVFHIESISHETFCNFVTNTEITVGVSALNSTPYDELKKYAAVADYVQVMGIAEIGVQGQPFDARALERIASLQRDFPELMLSLDGSVNEATMTDLAKLRLSRYIAGSAITKSANPRQAYQNLTDRFFNR